MYFRNLALAGALTAILGITTGTIAIAENFKRITTEKEFRQLVVGKRGVSEAGWYIVHADGKTSGDIFGKKFAANWVWRDKMYCRNAVLGKEQLGTDCQVVKISGNQVQFIRKYGKGGVGTSTLK